jgi:hypothetical protein
MTSARCNKCNKKLGIHEYKCRCGNIFCITHLHSTEHNCTYDYKDESNKNLSKTMEIGRITPKFRDSI